MPKRIIQALASPTPASRDTKCVYCGSLIKKEQRAWRVVFEGESIDKPRKPLEFACEDCAKDRQ